MVKNHLIAAVLTTLALRAAAYNEPPEHLLAMAKQETYVLDKTHLLSRFIRAYPSDPRSMLAREQLVSLFKGSNRYEDALQAYRAIAARRSVQGLDLVLLDYLLKTGRYKELLRLGSLSSASQQDFTRSLQLLELRVQALLAQGNYLRARQDVNQWLALYSGEAVGVSYFEHDVESIRLLERYLQILENLHGPEGSPLFTSSTPDSLRQWSVTRNVPIVFFKLTPANGPVPFPSSSSMNGLVDQMNQGFEELSGGLFSLSLHSLNSLYMKPGDLDPLSPDIRELTARVYMHSLAPLYSFEGKAFVVLVDYRPEAGNDASYMGDGLIYIPAHKLREQVLMHEILHGLGATHRDWSGLESAGYRFDPEDRGLMTFEKGELKDWGLEEKNRTLLGWPRRTDRKLLANSYHP